MLIPNKIVFSFSVDRVAASFVVSDLLFFSPIHAAYLPFLYVSLCAMRLLWNGMYYGEGVPGTIPPASYARLVGWPTTATDVVLESFAGHA